MYKTVRNIIIFVLLASTLTVLIILGRKNSVLPSNPDSFVGNTAGNLNNGGYFAEDSKYIYFANYLDQFRLYRMDKKLQHLTLLQKDSVMYLNLDSASQNLFYSRINYRKDSNNKAGLDLSSSGIYRLNLKTRSLNQLYKNTCGIVALMGNRLYFQSHGADGNFDLCCIASNQKNARTEKLSEDFFSPGDCFDGRMYYTGVGKDHFLYSFHAADKSSELLAEIDGYLPLTTSDGVYFLSMLHNYNLYFLPNAENTAELISERRISTYNISSDQTKIFYQVDEKEESRICVYDLSSGTETVLMNGNFKNLNVVDNYLFFNNFSETEGYVYNYSEDSLFAFTPYAD